LLQHIVNAVGIRGASMHRRIALLAPTCSPLEHVNGPFDDVRATLGDVIEAVRVEVVAWLLLEHLETDEGVTASV
jgi:hypothetical protein